MNLGNYNKQFWTYYYDEEVKPYFNYMVVFYDSIEYDANVGKLFFDLCNNPIKKHNCQQILLALLKETI